MERDFETFIFERINNNQKKLRNTRKWKTDISNFNSVYEDLCKGLSLEEIEKLDKLLEYKNSLTYFEICFAYKLAFTDVIKLFKM